jgi:hypothetical protein
MSSSLSKSSSGAASSVVKSPAMGSINLLKPLLPEEVGKKCLVLDLDGMIFQKY